MTDGILEQQKTCGKWTVQEAADCDLWIQFLECVIMDMASKSSS